MAETIKVEHSGQHEASADQLKKAGVPADAKLVVQVSGGYSEYRVSKAAAEK